MAKELLPFVVTTVLTVDLTLSLSSVLLLKLSFKNLPIPPVPAESKAVFNFVLSVSLIKSI